MCDMRMKCDVCGVTAGGCAAHPSQPQPAFRARPARPPPAGPPTHPYGLTLAARLTLPPSLSLPVSHFRPQARAVWIGGLPDVYSEEDLRALFSPHGAVSLQARPRWLLLAVNS
jgi:hypothetical protein